LELLVKNILEVYSTNKITTNQNETLYKIEKYILQNIEYQITLDDIAMKLGYSKEHIIRIFKKEFGLSPHAFLMNAKLNRAKYLLEISKNINLSQIALDVGFYDQSHLNKFFKKTFGITPNEYKLH